MDDDTMERKDRYFHSAESSDGPDTVRILPDKAPSNEREEWRVQKHPMQHGALYAPTPAPAAKPAVPADEEATAGENLALQPYDHRPLKTTIRNQESAIERSEAPVSTVTHVH